MVKKVYNNRWLTISKDKDYYFYDENYDQVVIIPVINKNNLVMVNQFRKPLKKYCLEFPAGGVNKNESPSKAAIRELYEETGIKVKNVQKIFRQIKLSINPQRSKAYPYAFMAKIDNKYIEILRKYSKKKFSKEIESVNIIKIRDFFKLVRKGKIVSSYMIAIFYMYLLREKLINFKD